jgi:phenylalanine-4-hydroxylase
VLEPVQAPLDGWGRQVDVVSDVLERAARILSQQRNDCAINVVHAGGCGRVHATDHGCGRDLQSGSLHGEPLMFEEAQLYAPVTTDADGAVTVHLADDHPGFADPAYRARRNHIASLALGWEPTQPIPRVDYTDAEQEVWRTVCRELAHKHARLACAEYREAFDALELPTDRIPQLDEVGARLRPLTGFEYHPAAGLVPFDEFYGSLADGVFHSTQYVRHHARPLYTPEPDLIHEVVGHGGTLASPTLAELNRLAGRAARRIETQRGRDFFATVFWFTIEFGVVWQGGDLRAYGAGLLSSYGEIDEFRGAEIRPLDIPAMGVQGYDITKYQPVLYAADGIGQLLEVIGGFFDACDDDAPDRFAARQWSSSRQ